MSIADNANNNYQKDDNTCSWIDDIIKEHQKSKKYLFLS